MYDRLSQSLVMGIRRAGELQKFPQHGRQNDPKKLQACANIMAASGPKKCHFCELRSELMEVHHIDHNHENWARSNLVWACPLCHQVSHSFEAGLMGSRVIFAPDIKQQTLNNLQRMLIVMLYHSDQLGTRDHLARAKRLFTMLAQYSTAVQKQWTSHKLVDFALKMQKLTPDQYRHRAESLEGLRVLFNPEMFKDESVFWAKEALTLMPAKEWLDSYEDVVIAKGVKTLAGAPPQELLRETVDIKDGSAESDPLIVEDDRG